MTIRVRDQKEFVAGTLFLVIGVVWGAASLQYPMGTALRMGPGYFPFAVSVFLAILGVGSMLRAVTVADPEELETWNALPLVFILLSVAAFAVLLQYTGLIAAVLAEMILSCYARVFSHPIEVIALSVFTTAFVVGLFVYGLDLPLRLY